MGEKIVEVPGVGNVAFPDTMGDDAIAAQLQKHSTPAPSIQQPQGSAAGRFLKGAWDTLNPMPALRMVADLAQTGASPGRLVSPETAQAFKGILDSHVEQARKAKASFDQGNHVEAAGHLLGALVPLVGPAAAAAGEQIGGSAPEYDRYGSVTKPGQAPDIAGGLGRAAGLLAGVAAPAIAARAAKVGASPAVTGALERSAQTQYSRVLNATTKGNKLRSAEIVPEMIDRGYAGLTLKGMQAKAAGKISEVGHAIGDAYESLPDGASVPLDDVLSRLDSHARDAFTVGGVPASAQHAAGIRLVEDLKERLAEVSMPAEGVRQAPAGLLERGSLVTPTPADTSSVGTTIPGREVARSPETGRMFRNYTGDQALTPEVLPPESSWTAPPATGPGSDPVISRGVPSQGVPEPRVISVSRLRKLRQLYDETAQLAGRFDGKSLADHTQASVQGMAADSIRELLANKFPDIAALNKEYSFWKDVDRVVGDTLTRRQGQAKPLGRKIASATAQAAGFSTGGVHGAILGRVAGESLEALATSPAWQTVSAVMKDRLAKAMAAGDRPGSAYWINRMSKSVAPGAAVNVLEQQSAPAALPAGQ